MKDYESIYDEARGPSRVPRRAIQMPRLVEAAAPRDDWFYYRADWLRWCPPVPSASEPAGGAYEAPLATVAEMPARVKREHPAAGPTNEPHPAA